MMVALSFNEDIVPLTSSSKQSAPLNLFLECAYVDRFGLKTGFSTKLVGDLTGTRLTRGTETLNWILFTV